MKIDQIDTIQAKVKGILENEGAAVRMVEYERAGNMLVAEIGSERTKPAVMFMGHIDTVFKIGTIEKRPFTIQDDKAYGPGILDMKGGRNHSLEEYAVVESLFERSSSLLLVYLSLVNCKKIMVRHITSLL